MPSSELLLQLQPGWSAELRCSAVVEDGGVFKNMRVFFYPITGQNTVVVCQFSPLEFTLLPALQFGGPALFLPGKATQIVLKSLLFPFELSHVSWSERGWKFLVWLSHSSFSRNGTCTYLHLVMTVLWIFIADQNEGSLQDLSDHSLGSAFRRLLISSVRNGIANLK